MQRNTVTGSFAYKGIFPMNLSNIMLKIEHVTARNQRATISAGQDGTVKLAVKFCCGLTSMIMLSTELNKHQINMNVHQWLTFPYAV